MVPDEGNRKLQSKYFSLRTKQRTELEQDFNPKVGHYIRIQTTLKFFTCRLRQNGVRQLCESSSETHTLFSPHLRTYYSTIQTRRRVGGIVT